MAKEEEWTKNFVTSRTSSCKDLVDAFVEKWLWRVGDLQVADSDFYADTSRCERCRFDGVCRRNDPSCKSRMLSQARLLNYES